MLKVEDWKTPLKKYLLIEELSSVRIEIVWFMGWAFGYCFINGALHKSSVTIIF